MQSSRCLLLILVFTGLLFRDYSAGAQAVRQSPQQASPVRPQTNTSEAATSAVWSNVAEDWSSLSIGSLRLGPAYANVTEHDVGPHFTRDVVRVQWRPGDPIELIVYTPHGVAKAPAVLYLYSYPSDIDRFYNPAWAERATANGFAAIGFVSALTGQRYANRPMKEWFVSELQESLGTSVHDVQMILNYLDSRGDIDMNRIGMFGQGSGGAIAVLAAEADTRIKALDLLDPWGDWPDWLKNSAQIPDEERSGYLKPEFLAKVAGLDPVVYLPKLSVRSLRIQQILSDPATPKAAMDRIAAASPSPADVSRFADATAHFDAMHSTGVSGWLKRELSLPSTSSDSINLDLQPGSRSVNPQ